MADVPNLTFELRAVITAHNAPPGVPRWCMRDGRALRPATWGGHFVSVDTANRAGRAAELRNALVDKVIADHAAKGLVMRADVERAMRKVARDLFTPGATLEEAYEDTAVITIRSGEETISSVSAPYLIAEMLGQAADALGGLEGRDVLEVGSGGYNAALLRELVGPSGSVTTIDILAEVTERASACLAAAGYHDVTVVCADAQHPIEPGRRYDLIIVTAGAWDIPPAWREQLTDDGVLVVPLRTLGMTRSWALRRSGDRLVSHSNHLCGFVSIKGDGTHQTRYVDIADGVHLRLDELNQRIDPAVVADLLTQPREEAWAGVSLPPRTVLADLNLWLAARLTREPGEFVVLTAQESAVTSGIVAPSWRFGTPATFDHDAFCYRSALRWTGRRFDLGAYAHGPKAAAAAGRMVEHMRAWVDAGCPSPVLFVLPAHTPRATCRTGWFCSGGTAASSSPSPPRRTGGRNARHHRAGNRVRAERHPRRRRSRERVRHQHRRQLRLGRHRQRRLRDEFGRVGGAHHLGAVASAGRRRRRRPAEADRAPNDLLRVAFAARHPPGQTQPFADQLRSRLAGRSRAAAVSCGGVVAGRAAAHRVSTAAATRPGPQGPGRAW